MEKRASGFHKMALAALFTVGNALIRYPWRGENEDFLPLFLLSVAGALIPAVFLYPIFRWIWRRPLSHRRGRMILVALLSAFFGAYALVCAWQICADYLRFSMRLVLPMGSRWLLLMLFVVCAVWLSTLRDGGMDSFAGLAFLLAVFCAVFLFLSGLSVFKWEHVPQKPLAWEWGSLGGSFPILRETLLPAMVLAVYFALAESKGGARSLAFGTLIGCAILFLCVAETILTFGASYAAGLEYPYSYAVRILSIGQYYFRLEGFSYLLDYLTCLIRAAVSLATLRRLIGRFCPRLAHRFSWGAGVGLLAILWIQ